MPLTLFIAAIVSAGLAGGDERGFSAAARSLDGRPECVAFRWEDDGRGTTRAAISVAVKLNGTPMRFQFDTGADTSILYGTNGDAAGWSLPADDHFRPNLLSIGTAQMARPYVRLLRSMPADGVQGTLGLQALVGRVAVIDYPGQRLCLFHEADLPRSIGASARFVSGSLHDGHLFVPVQVGGEHWRDVMLDTGSSALPLALDLDRWRVATGHATTNYAPQQVSGISWGKPVTFAGAPLAAPLRLGGSVDLGKPVAFTKAGAPTAMASRPFALDAILGNAALWNGMVVLILTGRIDVGYIAQD